MSGFSIYRASAGSGKTYALTYNYLRLALKDPQNSFRQILAVTFTNKATEEMKSRILDTLKELKSGQGSMTHDLVRDLNISEAELQIRSETLLSNIVHYYSSFAVSTIDTFFQKIVRSFAREMGVQTGFKIELDQNLVLEEVIDHMLKNISEDQMLVQWLTDFALSRLSAGNSWEMKGEIHRLSRELFQEKILMVKHELFDQLGDPEFMPSFLQSIYFELGRIEKGYREIGQDVVQLLSKHGLSAKDFSYGLSGVGGYMLRVSEGEFKEPSTRVFQAVNDDKWYSKTSKAAGHIEAALDEGLKLMLDQMVRYYKENARSYHSIAAAVKNIYAFGLLSKVSEGIDAYREENELLLISDFPLFLHQIINDSDSPYIYEKTGTRFQHYLIDEFQDTSMLQWQNFRPLIEDSLSQEQFNMVVGDVKQSIYRWRGGDWKILLNQVEEEVDSRYVDHQSLSTNRRSKENIVKFNNDLFEKAPLLLEKALTDRLDTDEKSPMLQAAYSNATQDLYDESGEGQISLHFVEKKRGDDLDVEESMLDHTIRQIQFLQERNYEPSDITILVRKNDKGRAIADHLMNYALKNPGDGYSYDFISNETLMLKNNSAVHLILQGLLHATDPSDSLKIEQLIHACYHHGIGEVKDISLEDYWKVLADDKPSLLTDRVSCLIKAFDLLSKEEDVPYVMAFQDAVLDYLKYDYDGVLEFLDWWEQNDRRSLQLNDDQNAIKIMTIHKSKGLQFKAVLIPFCDWSLDHSGVTQPLLWCSTEPLDSLSAIDRLPIRYKSDLNTTHFSHAYYQEKNDVYLDNLNLLYVAVTRAEEYLFLGGKTSFGLQSVADLIVNIHDLETDEESCKKLKIGELPEYSGYEIDHREKVVISTKLSNQIGSHELGFRMGKGILDDSQQKSINYGDIIHWILSQIATKSDFSRALDLAVAKFNLSITELSEIKTLLRTAWELPHVSSWFSSDWSVRNEASILMDSGKLKRPDRVISNGDHAIVVDYKTGKRSNGHLAQVKEYKEILRQMGYQSVEGYLLYLSTLEVVNV